MKIKEIIQRIQALYSKGVKSDDSRLRSRHIYNKMLTVRALLLSRKASKKQKISQWNYQTLPCVEMIEALPNECPCVPPVGCKILRSVYKLPRPITDLGSHLIQSVTNLDGSIIYSEVSWKEKKYKSGSKYTSGKPDFFIKYEYLFLTHRKGPATISITGLFQDPVDAMNFPTCCEKNCKDCDECDSPLDMEFPLDNAMVETMIKMCVEELIGVFAKSIEDITNNTRDNLPKQTK